jgi:hypothetical protein
VLSTRDLEGIHGLTGICGYMPVLWALAGACIAMPAAGAVAEMGDLLAALTELGRYYASLPRAQAEGEGGAPAAAEAEGEGGAPAEGNPLKPIAD